MGTYSIVMSVSIWTMAVFVNLPLYTTSVDFTSHNQNLIELQTLVQGNKSIQLLTV